MAEQKKWGVRDWGEMSGIECVAELNRLEAERAELMEALKYQLATGKGCTCLSMTSYDCPYHLAHYLLARLGSGDGVKS